MLCYVVLKDPLPGDGDGGNRAHWGEKNSEMKVLFIQAKSIDSLLFFVCLFLFCFFVLGLLVVVFFFGGVCFVFLLFLLLYLV